MVFHGTRRPRRGARAAATAIAVALLTVGAWGCHTRATSVSRGNEPTMPGIGGTGDGAAGAARSGPQGNTTGISTTRPGGTPRKGTESPTKTIGLSPNSTAGANAGRRPVVEGNGTTSSYGASPFPGSSRSATGEAASQNGRMPPGVAGGTVFAGGRDTHGIPAPGPPASRKEKVNRPTGEP